MKLLGKGTLAVEKHSRGKARITLLKEPGRELGLGIKGEESRHKKLRIVPYECFAK